MKTNSLTFRPKLNSTSTNIFTVMSKLAQEHNAINLGQGFPDFDTDPILLDLVARYVKEGKNQYSPLAGLPRLLEAISTKIDRCYGVTVNPESQICVTAGATQALFTGIMTFINPGDEVIIIEPAYDCYKPQIELAGGVVITYPLKYPSYKVDWDDFGRLVNDRTRMIIINTPHNPTGTILSERDLKALEVLVSGKNVIVLSDEVYEHLIFDGQKHQSVLRYPDLFRQSMAVFSFGKTLHCTGWKMGYIVGPEELISAFKAVHQWNVFCANSFLQHAIADYLELPERYERLPDFFQEKRDHMNEHFQAAPIKPVTSRGTYFQLFEYKEVSNLSDLEFAKHLTEKVGVTTIPLSPFYTQESEDQVIRICFAKTKETIEAAALRLAKL